MNRPSENIINKVLEGLASEEEARIVAEWFGTNEGQTYLSQKLDEDFSSIKNGCEDLLVGHKIPSEEMYHIILQHIRKKKVKRILFRIAAVLLPFIFISGLFIQLNSKVDLFGNVEYEEVYVPKGERIQLMFQDGTRVYVNSDSKIRFPKKFGLSERSIYVEGEAYFIVAPNNNRPFIVEIEKGKIQVLGTSFNVEAYPTEKDIKVTLDEGRINLIPWTKKNNYLQPGEKIIFNKETGECIILKDENIQVTSSWKKDVIAFSNTSLSEVIERLNRWYNVQFIVEDQDALRYSYTFTTENTLLDNVLSDLEKVAPVKFIHEGNIVRVKLK